MARAATKAQDAEAAVLEPTAEISPVAKVARAAPKQMPAYEVQPEGIKWGRWGIMAKAEHTVEDALSPIYLFSKADMFQAGDYVEIKHPFGHWVVCLDVVRIDKQARGIVSHVRHIFDYTKAARTIQPDLSRANVQHLGANGWAVVDGRHVVADEFISQEAAEEWLSERKVAD